ncbi:MAG: hypothetical protein HRT88_10625 [Lentisphaeraceae bacterium]|nr:hypothetical protein [Lentisphaeraceae bacterium]
MLNSKNQLSHLDGGDSQIQKAQNVHELIARGVSMASHEALDMHSSYQKCLAGKDVYIQQLVEERDKALATKGQISDKMLARANSKLSNNSAVIELDKICRDSIKLCKGYLNSEGLSKVVRQRLKIKKLPVPINKALRSLGYQEAFIDKSTSKQGRKAILCSQKWRATLKGKPLSREYKSYGLIDKGYLLHISVTWHPSIVDKLVKYYHGSRSRQSQQGTLNLNLSL